MRVLKTMAAAAVAVVALLATPAAAHASFAAPFAANSGDTCRYAGTQGTLLWRYSTTAPIRPISVEARGMLLDHPLPNEYGFLCRDDRFYAVATFTAFTGAGLLRADVLADNEVATIGLTLGPTPTASGISRVVVQVCRHPLPVTQPPLPGYCGMPQHYSPVVYDPPGLA